MTNEYITKQQVIELVKRCEVIIGCTGAAVLTREIERMPVKQGNWLKSEDDYCGLNIYQCSLCHEEWCFEIDDDVKDLNYKHCPNCGAYMMGWPPYPKEE